MSWSKSFNNESNLKNKLPLLWSWFPLFSWRLFLWQISQEGSRFAKLSFFSFSNFILIKISRNGGLYGDYPRWQVWGWRSRAKRKFSVRMSSRWQVLRSLAPPGSCWMTNQKRLRNTRFQTLFQWKWLWSHQKSDCSYSDQPFWKNEKL